MGADPGAAPPTMLALQPLDSDAFRPFGDAITADKVTPLSINDGYTERFNDLANIDVAARGGRPLVSIFRTQPFAMPHRLTMLERHPLSSQGFYPASSGRFIAVVAPAGASPSPGACSAFLCGPGQGLNLARGVWHHPLMPVDGAMDFVVVDRGAGPDDGDANCDIADMARWNISVALDR